MKTLLLAATFLFVSQAFAQVFHKDFDNNEAAELNEENYVIISHATSFWDKDKSANEGVRNMVTFATDARVTSLAAVHEDALNDPEVAAQYYVTQSDVNYVYMSDAGQHKFRFPRLKNAIIGGGNLTLCLCETIRDVVRGAKKNEDLNLVLVKDAIYDWEDDYDNITEDFIDKFVTAFFIPHFACPWQNWHNFPALQMKGLRLDIYSESKLIKKYDLEPGDEIPLEKLTKAVNVRFVSSKNLKSTFDRIR